MATHLHLKSPCIRFQEQQQWVLKSFQIKLINGTSIFHALKVFKGSLWGMKRYPMLSTLKIHRILCEYYKIIKQLGVGFHLSRLTFLPKKTKNKTKLHLYHAPSRGSEIVGF